MGKITKISTKDMSREDWLNARRSSIGGSDAASVLGLNQYSSPYALWADKTGKAIPEDISDREAVRLGNDLEQYVAERWMEATGKKVRRENNILYNSEYPFAHANPDRMVIGENAGLECKTTSSWEVTKQLRDGKIPDYWYVQCSHYMMITGADRWYLGALAFGHGFYHFCIERNEAEINALEDAERCFWDLVETNTPPAVDGSPATTTAIQTIFHDSAYGSSCDLTAVGHHIEMYNALNKQIKELEAERDIHCNEIKQFMGTAEKGSYGNTSISWKSGMRRTFDKEAYERVKGRIEDQYYKVNMTRTFRVTVK